MTSPAALAPRPAPLATPVDDPSLLPADGLPALRLVPVPPCEPPYDDELPPRPGRTTGLAAPLGPLRLLAPVPLRLVPEPLPAWTPPLPGQDDEDGPRLTPSADLPAARPVAQALVQGLLEVLGGVRPVTQLQRSTSHELYLRLEELVAALPRSGGSRPVTGAVRTLHVQQRPEGVAEVCATVRRGARLAALALRLEGRGGRWTCTAVDGL